MTPKTELRLLGLISLAFLGAGMIIWGTWSGRLTIFGDSDPVTNTPQSVLTISPRALAPQVTSFTEEFNTTATADGTKLTARWDAEAGNVTLESGKLVGLAQSLTVATVTGSSVKVTIDPVAFLPNGSQISYAVSANGGQSWEPIFPGRAVTVRDPAGDWRWRALIDRGGASLNPTLDNLVLDFTVIE